MSSIVDEAYKAIGFDPAPCSQCDHPKGAHQAYENPAECAFCGCDHYQPYPEAVSMFEAEPCQSCEHQRVAHLHDTPGSWCDCCPCLTFRAGWRQHATDLAVLAVALGVALTLGWAVIRQVTG